MASRRSTWTGFWRSAGSGPANHPGEYHTVRIVTSINGSKTAGDPGHRPPWLASTLSRAAPRCWRAITDARSNSRVTSDGYVQSHASHSPKALFQSYTSASLPSASNPFRDATPDPCYNKVPPELPVAELP